MSTPSADPKPSKTITARWLNIGIIISAVGIIIFTSAFCYGYFQLAQVNITLARAVGEMRDQLIKTETTVIELQQSVQTLQQTAQKTQSLSDKQEQLIASWEAAQKGNMNKWYIAEAYYLVKLANDHMQFTHNLFMANQLLQHAAQVLQNVPDPGLLEIRKSLANDIATLQSIPQVDASDVYLHLMALDNQFDKLPLPATPLKANGQIFSTDTAALPWWKAGLKRSWQALSQIVIVRKEAADGQPLVMPEEKIFLYQNLHAEMQNAMWAALHHNVKTYQTSLERAVSWIHQYFDQDAMITKMLLQNLQALQKINIQSPLINASATLKLFNQYLAK